MKIKSKTFSGSSKLFDGTLAAMLMGLAVFQAATIAKGLSDITDNSTGAAGATITAPVATAFTSVGTDAAGKTTTDTALGTVKDALTVLQTAAKAVGDAIGVTTVTVSTGGTIAVAGTVPAVTKSVTAVAGSAGTGVGIAGTKTVIAALQKHLSHTLFYVNEIAAACGAAQLPWTQNANVDRPAWDRVFPALTASTGTAATAGEAAALGTMSKAAMDAQLTAIANDIATLAAKLNEVTDAARVVVPTVHAG